MQGQSIWKALFVQSATMFLKKTHLLAFEESFSVTVGKVQRQGHNTRSVLHSLNDPIQFSPAWTLWEKIARGYNGCAKALKYTFITFKTQKCMKI